MENNYDNLLAKYFSGECSEQEKKNVLAQIEKSADSSDLIDILSKIWNSKEANPVYSDPQKAWNEFISIAGIKEKEPKVIPFYKNVAGLLTQPQTLLKYAAALIIIFLPLLYFSLTYFNSTNEINYSELTVPAGEIKELILPDGTEVTLNSGTSLKYPKEFARDERKVELNGEAFFHVTKDTQRPFIVNADEARAKVLGTKFNLSTWNNKVDLAVTEGKVSFINVSKDTEVVLVKGMRSRIIDNSAPSPPEEFAEDQILSWIDFKVYLENETFENVAKQLERWYGVEIKINSNVDKNMRMNISLKKSSVEENLKIINLVTGVNYEITNKQVKLFNSK